MESPDEGNMIKNIQEALICPICEKTLTPPIVECKNGHLVCKKHKKSKCPTCKTKLSAVSPAFLSRILTSNKDVGLPLTSNSSLSLEVLPTTRKCNHPGCSQMVMITDDHELWCGRRPAVCMFDDTFNNCKWVGVVSKLVKHVESEHYVNVCNENALSVIHDVSFYNIDITKHTGWGVSNGHFFWLVVENNAFKHSFTFKVILVPHHKIEEAHNIWIEIRTKSSKFCGVTKLDLNPHTYYPGKNTVTIHTNLIKDAVREDRKLWYKLDLVKEVDSPFGSFIV